MERSSKILEGEVAHLDFGIVAFEILEPVDGASLCENVVGAKEDDVEFLQVVIAFAPVQGFAVAHGLVEACPLGDFVGVFHLHLDIETPDGFAIGPDLFCEDVEADALADGADLDGLLMVFSGSGSRSS